MSDELSVILKDDAIRTSQDKSRAALLEALLVSLIKSAPEEARTKALLAFSEEKQVILKSVNASERKDIDTMFESLLVKIK